jgi:hypothetical protein
MGSWHQDEEINDEGAHCGTTHCRAGWVVALAGKAGRDLEKFHNTLQAARMIYDASDPNYRINPCRFFDSNDDALADMKKLAEGVTGNG